MSGNQASRRTPYNDSYPTSRRALAKLVIYPETLDPHLISERLGIQPTRLAVKGVDSTTPSGAVRPAPKSLWALSSEGQVDSRDLRRHLDWLIEKLLPARDQLLALQDVPGTSMAVFCIWWSARGQGGPTLWPEQMAAMAELGLECTFDVSFFGEEPEPPAAG